MERSSTDEERRLSGIVANVVDTVAEVILTRTAARLAARSPAGIMTGEAKAPPKS